MRFLLGLTLYRMVLPVLFFTAFPGWWRRMLERGGLGTRLRERLARYDGPADFEPCGVVHVHAVSVGETMLALKLIREWRVSEPERTFVLATGTATGHAVGTGAALTGVRVTYAPLDFRHMVRRYLNRFEPSRIILVEGEAWPHLLLACKRRGIPVTLVNARFSPRSARRYERFAAWLRPVFACLEGVFIQEPGDADRWRVLGLPADRIHAVGSLKIDPGSGPSPARRAEFSTMLAAFSTGSASRPVVLAASTHAGEEAWLASAIRAAMPDALPVIVPRHAERRAMVATELAAAGFEVVLRSAFSTPNNPTAACLVVDSTGELRDWTAHSAVVIIGKSFLATGGQNPCEAIQAGIPVICGPHMENFEPLASQLTAAGGCDRPGDATALAAAIRRALDPAAAATLTAAAAAVLAPHRGATRRIVDWHLDRAGEKTRR